VTIFVIVAIVGLAVLLLSVFVDGIGDAFDLGGGSGIISGASIGGLISGIGFGGLLGSTFTDEFWLIVVIAGSTGLVVAAAAVVWFRWLQRAQGDEADAAISGIVGGIGTVRNVSSEDSTTGTVAVTYLGAARTMQFIADAPLKAGALVTVTQIIDPETVRVERSDST
jgi:hypothetical protein